MKVLKCGLLFSVLVIFTFACSQNSSQTENKSVTGNSGDALTNNNSTANGATNPAGTDELAAARKIYEEKCIKCHKADGAGGVTDIEGTKIKAPNFTTDRQKAMPDSEYIETIENGAKEDGMPAYKGKISDDDIKNLVKYIRRNFQGK